MPAHSEFGDGTTVIEGPTPTYAHAHVPIGSSRGKGAEASLVKKAYSTFAKTSDYFSESRPFVVHIGKKGVIGALQDLDSLLREVCAFSLSRPCWVFPAAHDPFLRFACCRRDITRSFPTRCVTCSEGALCCGPLLGVLIRRTDFFFPSARIEPHELDRQGDWAGTHWAHQSWWLAKGAHETGTLSRFPVPQLVGAYLQRDAWT